MAAIDAFLADKIRQYGPYIAGLFVLYKITAVVLRKLYPYGYAYFVSSRLAPMYNKGMHRHKEELFGDLNDRKAQFEKENPDEKFTILEIGVGSGTNFQYYPEGTTVIAVEPKEQFQKYLEESTDEFPRVRMEQVLWQDAENMHKVPDESVSAVVCTLVLCSVKDLNLVLKEVKRVLKVVIIHLFVCLFFGGLINYPKNLIDWEKRANV